MIMILYVGLHLEGPFINVLKYGAHEKKHVVQSVIPNDNSSKGSLSIIEERYGSLDDVKIITVAPELSGMLDVIPLLKERGIVVSAGNF